MTCTWQEVREPKQPHSPLHRVLFMFDISAWTAFPNTFFGDFFFFFRQNAPQWRFLGQADGRCVWDVNSAWLWIFGEWGEKGIERASKSPGAWKNVSMRGSAIRFELLPETPCMHMRHILSLFISQTLLRQSIPKFQLLVNTTTVKRGSSCLFSKETAVIKLYTSSQCTKWTGNDFFF